MIGRRKKLIISPVTTSSPFKPIDIVICLALTIRFHGPDAEALRGTIVRISKHCQYEHRAKLKRLALMRDAPILSAAWQMIDQTCELMGEGETPAPRCHMKPMRFAGYFYYCQHCTHTKLREFP